MGRVIIASNNKTKKKRQYSRTSRYPPISILSKKTESLEIEFREICNNKVFEPYLGIFNNHLKQCIGALGELKSLFKRTKSNQNFSYANQECYYQLTTKLTENLNILRQITHLSHLEITCRI
jgi:hypothetical protein